MIEEVTNLGSTPPGEKIVTHANSPIGFNHDLERGDATRSPRWRWPLFGIDKRPDLTRQQLRERSRTARKDLKETETRSLESCPIGYPRLAAFLSSESDFSQYRGFHYLRSRVILRLQDELAALEQELDGLDKADEQDDRSKNLTRQRWGDKPKNARPPADGFRPRGAILDDVRQKLLEFDEMIFRARDIQALQRPSGRDYRTVRSFFWNESPIHNEEEACFIRKREDIISLRSGREWSGFDEFIENTIQRFDGRLTRVSRPFE